MLGGGADPAGLRSRLLARAPALRALLCADAGKAARRFGGSIGESTASAKVRTRGLVCRAARAVALALALAALIALVVAAAAQHRGGARRRALLRRVAATAVEDEKSVRQGVGRAPRLSVADYPVVFVADSPPFRGAATPVAAAAAAAGPLLPDAAHGPAPRQRGGHDDQGPKQDIYGAPGNAPPAPQKNNHHSLEESARVALRDQSHLSQDHNPLGAARPAAEPDLGRAPGFDPRAAVAPSPVPAPAGSPLLVAQNSGGAGKTLPRIGRVPATKELAMPQGIDPAVEPVLRIIVLTMNRPASLKRLLVSLTEADYEGDRVDLDIWIDRANDTDIAENIIQSMASTARECHWSFGVRTIHKREHNAGLYEQWIYSWNVTDESTETAVILEDDLQVSPFFYVWLKRARVHYHLDPSVAAFTLQRGELRPRRPKDAPWTKLSVSQNHPVFKYKLLGTWGFAPQKAAWLDFRAWFEEMRQVGAKPYVRDLITTQWYREQEAKAGGDYAPSMWSQWFIMFTDVKHYYTVYANIVDGTTLASNWREDGLHYESKEARRGADFPVFRGPASKLSFPETLINLDWDGTEVDPEDFASQLNGRTASDSGTDKSVAAKQVSAALPGAAQSPLPARRVLR